MRLRSVILGVAMGLSVLPAGAFMAGYTYVDGSDSVLGGLPEPRARFEATLQGELDGANVVELKGLSHPVREGRTQPDGWTICGLVRDVSHGEKEFRRFWYIGDDYLASVEPDRDSVVHKSWMRHFKEDGCAAAVKADG